MELSYDEAWLASAAARPLSLSLPMNLDGVPLKGDKVGFFFDNLLPDTEAIRQRLRAKYGTKTGGTFDLLEAIGRDCVGAVQLLPEGQVPEGLEEISATALSEAEIARLLRGVAAPASALDDDEDFRISIAGAQEKTALTRHGGRWCKPHGSTPTTHIFKLPLGLVGGRQLDMGDSLENEWLCAQLLRAYGVAVASCEVQELGGVKALVVERFDRALHSSKRYWLRLPQEDLCQATGTPSSHKYESEGGPGLVRISELLGGSVTAERDLETLMRAQLLFWMLAATDGHAKNFSLRILTEGRYQLTPLYDVLSAWPVTGPRNDQIHLKKLKLAMAVRGASKHYRVADVQRRHFNTTAAQCGLGPDMDPLIADVIARTPKVIDEVGASLPGGFPGALFESITKGLQRSAKQLARMPAA
jgi:serine/threonine-protein kinase HipA